MRQNKFICNNDP